MTDISVSTASYQVEKRSWLIVQPGAIGHGFTPSITLDVSAFTAGTHYPNGYFPSGLAISELVSGLWGPLDTALTGKHGLLYGSIKVPNPAVTTVDVAAAAVCAFAVVKLSKLPIALNSTGQGKMPLIHFVA